MVFTLVLNTQDNLFADLLQLYYPKGCKIIDFTYGTGGLWWKIMENPYYKKLYKITACDKEPSPKLKDLDNINVLDICKDDYSKLGLHDVGAFDPPYLLGRTSFEYSSKLNKHNHTQIIPTQYQGKRSWSNTKLGKYVSNQSLSQFNERVEYLKVKACQVIKPGGLLFVKVMDPRYKKKLIAHHINITNILRDRFELMDHQIYIRQGATTWKSKTNLQNLHGHILIYKRNVNESL